MQKFCLAIDLKNDPALIREYEAYHVKARPEIYESIVGAGITNMEIYRVENHLFMIIEALDDFTFEKKETMDAASEKVQQWEHLMWQYQQALPSAKPGEKWVLMKKIFQL